MLRLGESTLWYPGGICLFSVVVMIPGGILESGVFFQTVDLLSSCCKLAKYIVALVRKKLSLYHIDRKSVV